jgi:hypothetical protein
MTLGFLSKIPTTSTSDKKRKPLLRSRSMKLGYKSNTKTGKIEQPEKSAPASTSTSSDTTNRDFLGLTSVLEEAIDRLGDRVAMFESYLIDINGTKMPIAPLLPPPIPKVIPKLPNNTSQKNTEQDTEDAVPRPNMFLQELQEKLKSRQELMENFSVETVKNFPYE